jgi:hypothetical protein
MSSFAIRMALSAVDSFESVSKSQQWPFNHASLSSLLYTRGQSRNQMKSVNKNSQPIFDDIQIDSPSIFERENRTV